MPYRIDYGPMKKVRGAEKRRSPRAALGALCLLILLGLALWPRGARALRAVLIPGDPAVTVAALENLAGELRSGADVQEALEAFCAQVADLD